MISPTGMRALDRGSVMIFYARSQGGLFECSGAMTSLAEWATTSSWPSCRGAIRPRVHSWREESETKSSLSRFMLSTGLSASRHALGLLPVRADPLWSCCERQKGHCYLPGTAVLHRFNLLALRPRPKPNELSFCHQLRSLQSRLIRSPLLLCKEIRLCPPALLRLFRTGQEFLEHFI